MDFLSFGICWGAALRFDMLSICKRDLKGKPGSQSLDASHNPDTIARAMKLARCKPNRPPGLIASAQFSGRGFFIVRNRMKTRILLAQPMEKILLISAGAILGANLRYWLSLWAAQKWGADFPFGTLIINLTGSFLIGLFLTLAAERFLVDPRWRLLIAVGFLGAYTTFSTYAFESYNLLAAGRLMPALLNLLGSSLSGVLAVGLGIYAGKLMAGWTEWAAIAFSKFWQAWTQLG